MCAHVHEMRRELTGCEREGKESRLIIRMLNLFVRVCRKLRACAMCIHCGITMSIRAADHFSLSLRHSPYLDIPFFAVAVAEADVG